MAASKVAILYPDSSLLKKFIARRMEGGLDARTLLSHPNPCVTLVRMLYRFFWVLEREGIVPIRMGKERKKVTELEALHIKTLRALVEQECDRTRALSAEEVVAEVMRTWRHLDIILAPPPSLEL